MHILCAEQKAQIAYYALVVKHKLAIQIQELTKNLFENESSYQIQLFVSTSAELLHSTNDFMVYLSILVIFSISHLSIIFIIIISSDLEQRKREPGWR